MTIIRVFPRRTSYTPNDEYAFVGDPPMIRPQADEVHVSCTFTWDIEKAKRLADAWSQYYPTKLGGVAFDSKPNGFIPGMYIKQGVTFTTRGCNNQCPFCLVWKREGKLQQYTDFHAGNVIQDNNILQATKSHWNKVIEMLKTQYQVIFSGGLDTRLLKDCDADDIRGLRINQLFLACDSKSALKPLQKAIAKLQMPIQKIRCYVLIAYNGEKISEARERLEDVYHAGALPFAQLYQPPDRWIDYSQEWRDLARTFSRPAATVTVMESVNDNFSIQ